MITCDGCYMDALHENDDERARCIGRRICVRAYQNGREDAVSEFIKLADSIRFAKKLNGISCDWWEAMMEAQEKMKEQKNDD